MSPNILSLGIGVAIGFIMWRKFVPVKGCKDLSCEELKKLMKTQKDIKILDVRTPAEYKSGHIRGALSRPLAELEKWTDEFEKDQKLYLICASGMRSKAAARKLVQKGFTNLYNVKDGMAGWQDPNQN